MGGWKLASCLKTSMSDVISFVFFFLSGSSIRSDRKASIIKQCWLGVMVGGGGWDRRSWIASAQVENRQKGFDTSGLLLFPTWGLLFRVQADSSGFLARTGAFHLWGFVSAALLPADGAVIGADGGAARRFGHPASSRRSGRTMSKAAACD